MIAVYIIFPDKNCAEKISRKLLEKKLVACANIYPVDSHYLWKDEIESSSEYVAIYKTQQPHFSTIEKLVVADHPYEVPCITFWEIDAIDSYKQWVLRETSHGTLNIQ
jgi:periplasmic divalent cation tolerance protein